MKRFAEEQTNKQMTWKKKHRRMKEIVLRFTFFFNAGKTASKGLTDKQTNKKQQERGMKDTVHHEFNYIPIHYSWE